MSKGWVDFAMKLEDISKEKCTKVIREKAKLLKVEFLQLIKDGWDPLFRRIV